MNLLQVFEGFDLVLCVHVHTRMAIDANWHQYIFLCAYSVAYM